MLELGSRQNMTDIDTKRARGKCIANALVCQLCWIFLWISGVAPEIFAIKVESCSLVANTLFHDQKFFGPHPHFDERYQDLVSL